MTVAAVFLDRDGVINEDSGYVGHWDSFVFLPGVVDAMRELCDAGFALIIVQINRVLGEAFTLRKIFTVSPSR